MREAVRQLVEALEPCDAKEQRAIDATLTWIASGAELCRTESPDTPPEHLVSYFALVDGKQVLLGDHRKADLWLPCGGHVDPGEHPRDTVLREAQEELAIDAEFVFDVPIFLTRTQTQGAHSHTDVSLWYVVRGDRTTAYDYDRGEYRGLRWVSFDDLPPPDETDPELSRFCRKLKPMMELA